MKNFLWFKLKYMFSSWWSCTCLWSCKWYLTI